VTLRALALALTFFGACGAAHSPAKRKGLGAGVCAGPQRHPPRRKACNFKRASSRVSAGQGRNVQ
jgi:hypothetical protein